MRSLSLCSGIGGLDLALSPWCRTVGYVEREAFAQAVLLARMEDSLLDRAPIWPDLERCPMRALRGAVDIVVAGFPCQPFSTASRGRKVAESLWPAVSMVIQEVNPQFVFLENVQRGPIEAACEELSSLRWKARFGFNSSADVGSPIDRVRWWALAFPNDTDEPAIALDEEVASVRTAVHLDGWEEGPSRVLGMDNGVSARVDRLRALGNAVVWKQARLAFRRLASLPQPPQACRSRPARM